MEYRYNLQEPGDFSLSNVYLYSYRQGEGDGPYGIEIKSLISEINIFESISAKAITGNIVLADGYDVVEDLPLTGLERIEFTFSTPSVISNTSYDFTSKSGSPMYIYKIENRKRVNQSAQVYVLHFCSKEMYFNEKVRVNQAFDGTTDTIIRKFVKERDFLNSKKKLFLEPSKTLNKYVFPNKRPYEAIQMLADESISTKYNDSDYLFFENKQGIHFRSYESLIAYNGTRTRMPQESFYVESGSVRGGGGNNPVNAAMRRIRNYEVINQFDTLLHMRGGAFANELITTDFFNKTINTHTYNYFEEFPKHFHLASDKDGGKTDNGHLLPATASDEFDKGLEQYPSKRFVYSNTDKLHNDFVRPDFKSIIRQREAQKQLVNMIALRVEVSGNTTIDAGDVIYLEIPQVKAEPRGKDLFLSGNYVVRHLRHNISIIGNKHYTTIECTRDSVSTTYPSGLDDNTFIGRERNFESQPTEGIYNIYDIEESENLS